MRRSHFTILTCLILGFGPSVWAVVPSSSGLTKEQGYTSVVGKASDDPGRGIVMNIHNPRANEKPLSKKIFDAKLTKEFTERYQQTFGQSTAEENYNLPTQATGWYTGNGSKTQDETIMHQQNQFGMYMIRRTVEYHVNNYTKKSPSLKPAYEFSQRMTHMKVEMAKGYKLNGKYDLANNRAELDLGSPFCQSAFTLQMATGAIGPAAVQEAILDMNRNLTRTVKMDLSYKFHQRSVSLVGTKTFTPALSASLTGTQFFSDPSLDPNHKGNLLLAGLSWTY